MATGEYKIRGANVWVHVKYSTHSLQVSEKDYRHKAFKPDFDDLPWQDERQLNSKDPVTE